MTSAEFKVLLINNGGDRHKNVLVHFSFSMKILLLFSKANKKLLYGTTSGFSTVSLEFSCSAHKVANVGILY